MHSGRRDLGLRRGPWRRVSLEGCRLTMWHRRSPRSCPSPPRLGEHLALAYSVQRQLSFDILVRCLQRGKRQIVAHTRWSKCARAAQMWTCLYRKAPHEPILACAMLLPLEGQSSIRQGRSVWPQGGVQGDWRRAASLQLFASTRGESHHILRGAHLPFGVARMP